jgi:cystathionine gamma-synthase
MHVPIDPLAGTGRGGPPGREPGPSTRAVHLAEGADPGTRALIPPVVANIAFAYEDVDSWREVALGRAPGHIYSRNTNPTTHRFEAKVAALEGAEAATSFGTGMAAVSSTLLALLCPGARAVTVRDAYGGTYLLFTQFLPRWGVDCVVVDTDDQAGLLAAVGAGCDLLYLETPTNPTLKILDIARLSAAAHSAGGLVVVDNTFATPVNQSPLALGADLVLHSASKFLGGHGDVLGGVVAGAAGLVGRVFRFREIAGTGMDPHVASLLLRSLKTLALRVERQNSSALRIARWLAGHPKVAAVHYPGLRSHPGHQVAKQQMRGFGGVLSFELTGGFAAVKRVLPRLAYAYLAANLGQVETIAGPPATTSHVELTDAERARAGVPEGLIRYSAGIEDPEDLICDLAHALDAA